MNGYNYVQDYKSRFNELHLSEGQTSLTSKAHDDAFYLDWILSPLPNYPYDIKADREKREEDE